MSASKDVFLCIGPAAVQLGQRRIATLVEGFREQTASARWPLPVSMDEFTVDVDQTPECHPRDEPDRHPGNWRSAT